MHLKQFLDNVVRPVLATLADYSPKMNNTAIENLLICTAYHESDGFNALVQYGGGPAQGFMQVEPATHDDIWVNFLDQREGLADIVRSWQLSALDGADQLDGNVFYCTAVARLVYWRSPEPLPDAWDAVGLAQYYKCVFNTVDGKARTDHVAETFKAVLKELR